MSEEYGQESWEARWTQVLDQYGDKLAQMKPHAELVEAVQGLAPGRALDAGCGHGVEAMWLAGNGWRVTGVDFAPTALAQGQKIATDLGVADQIEWVQQDLGTWTPEPGGFDLVYSLYLHIAGDPVDFVQRMAAAVAPGGSLFLIGHQPADHEGNPTRAAGQRQVSVEDGEAALLTPLEVVEAAAAESRSAQGKSGKSAKPVVDEDGTEVASEQKPPPPPALALEGWEVTLLEYPRPDGNGPDAVIHAVRQG